MAPPLLAAPDTEYLPARVAGFLTEAHHAKSVGANRAVLLLTRSTIEAVAKEKGILSGNLVAKIDALKDAGLIRPNAQKMAHALCILGNDMAHGDIGEVPDAQDAADALRILGIILEDVYVAEAVTNEMLTRRGKLSGTND